MDAYIVRLESVGFITKCTQCTPKFITLIIGVSWNGTPHFHKCTIHITSFNDTNSVLMIIFIVRRYLYSLLDTILAKLHFSLFVTKTFLFKTFFFWLFSHLSLCIFHHFQCPIDLRELFIIRRSQLSQRECHCIRSISNSITRHAVFVSVCVIINRTSDLSCQYDTFNDGTFKMTEFCLGHLINIIVKVKEERGKNNYISRSAHGKADDCSIFAFGLVTVCALVRS